MKWAARMYKADNRLGTALEKAEDIRDRDVVMQVLIFRDGLAPRLLTMRVCGRRGMTATDEATGVSRRVSVRAVWAVAEAAHQEARGGVGEVGRVKSRAEGRSWIRRTSRGVVGQI